MTTVISTWRESCPAMLLLQQADGIYFTPHIPLKKIQGAMHYLPTTVQVNDIVLLVDDTVWGSAKVGLCVTDQAIYLKEVFEEPLSFNLAHVKSIQADTGIIQHGLLINGRETIHLTQLEKQSVRLLAEFLSQFLDFQQGGQTQSRQNPDVPMTVKAMMKLFVALGLQQQDWLREDTQQFIEHCFCQFPMAQRHYLKQLFSQEHEINLDQVLDYLLAAESQISIETKHMVVEKLLQLMLLEQFEPTELEQYLISLSTAFNIGVRDLDQIIFKVTGANEKNQNRAASIPDQVQQACQLLEIDALQLSVEILQKAYRVKMAEFHPDQYQHLPASVKAMLDEQAQLINQARSVLKEYLHG